MRGLAQTSGGSQRGVRLVYPSPGGHRVRQPPTRAGIFLTGHLWQGYFCRQSPAT